MATLRNKRKLAANNGDIQEEHPRKNQVRLTTVPRIEEDYLTPRLQELEGRVTKKLSEEFSRTECFGRPVLARRISSELKSSGSLRTRSGDIPEFKWKKLGNN